MKLIFAQGNFGDQYKNTRHNIGFDILNNYANLYKLKFENKPKLKAKIASFDKDGQKILLVKPTTYYNETGSSLSLVVNFFKVNNTSDILVIHDDLSFELGQVRIKSRGRDAGNNGIKSINALIGQDYMRLKIGINNFNIPINDKSDYVLGRFTKNELEIIDSEIVPISTKFINEFISQ